ncbi:MAG: hypothetical protein ACO3JL_04500 [Myxococcota bacterium]
MGLCQAAAVDALAVLVVDVEEDADPVDAVLDEGLLLELLPVLESLLELELLPLDDLVSAVFLSLGTDP